MRADIFFLYFHVLPRDTEISSVPTFSRYVKNTAAHLLIYSPAEASSLRMYLCFGKTAQQPSLSQ